MPDLSLQVSDRQSSYVAATERFLLGSGGFGSGKTRMLAVKLYMRAAVKGAREGLCRKHMSTLRATTLKTLLQGDGNAPPVIPPGSYEHNQLTKTISLRGGGSIVYFGLDDEKKIGSYNLTGCAVDEAIELRLSEWQQLAGRIRVQHPLGNQLYAVSNPGSPSHFLAELFGLGGGHQCKPGHRAIVSRSDENPWVDDAYLASLRLMTGAAFARFYEGRWVGAEGLVYDRWDRQIHVRDRPYADAKRIVIGIDDGYTNPFVCCRWQVDGDGRLWAERSVYSPGLLMDAKVEAVRELSTGAEKVIVDPSAALLIAELVKAGLPVEPADNAVFDGIQSVQNRLAVPGDGVPRLSVSPACKEGIAEAETYCWKVNRATGGKAKDDPVKENDHFMDQTRYVVRYVDKPTGGVMVDTPEAWRAYQQANPDLMMSDEGWTSVGSGGGHFIGM